jgi:hypothetical protein
VGIKDMKHNKYNHLVESEIKKEYGLGYRNRQKKMIWKWIKIVSALIVFAFFIWSLLYSVGLADMKYSNDVHKCISGVREINQNDELSTLNPQDCITNPYNVK